MCVAAESSGRLDGMLPCAFPSRPASLSRSARLPSTQVPHLKKAEAYFDGDAQNPRENPGLARPGRGQKQRVRQGALCGVSLPVLTHPGRLSRSSRPGRLRGFSASGGGGQSAEGRLSRGLARRQGNRLPPSPPGTMFTSTGSSGLYKAPLSKGLLIIPSIFSLLLALLFQHYQKFFTYNLQAVKEEFQIWRLLCGRTVCLDLKDTFCSSLLIYNFRIFERRYGSRKFSSFLLGSWMLSVMFDFVLVEAIEYSFGLSISSLPSGFLGPVFALFVPFYTSIPRVQVTQILGQFAITNKTLVYILGLQLLTSGSYIWIVALSGLISGMCYSSSLLKVYHILCVPSGIAKIFARTLEPIFSSAEPSNEFGVGMGATIDIQRQQRMELLDRQILISQVAQMRRQRQGGIVNWNRFFPPLRHRPNANYLDNHPTVQEGRPPAEVSEEQVARLMEMGFSRVDALEALRASNNDLNVATNFLLQH